MVTIESEHHILCKSLAYLLFVPRYISQGERLTLALGKVVPIVNIRVLGLSFSWKTEISLIRAAC